MFERLLIANRGEIAVRIMRTCRRLGIGTVAVFSDADRHARHVREADHAVHIGAAPARSSYLDAAAIVRAARESGADAVHPGYGFLSEKLELVDACAQAGLVFVGPHREAIRAMGSKIESKQLARAAGVACVPGYDGDDQSDARLAGEARALGFPLLIKASAGGGGKGLRRVDHADHFAAQLAQARAEAAAAFGDDRMLLERLIARPRHLEVQLLGDRHGHLVHLFERECSIQRNYQKLVEEAPAHHLTDATRERMFDAALALGSAIGYDSAGTVEFVLDAGKDGMPYFLEMNTRLQVEHPVTELTTGVDLVEWQLRSAAGQPLGFTQADIARQGWAIEARVNAESPAHDYRASFGAVAAYAEPELTGVRIDSGIDALAEITPHYDSMLAKVIGCASSRRGAVARARAGLRAFRIEGLETNQAFLDDVLGQAAFADVLSTGYLGDVFPGGWSIDDASTDERAAAAAAAWYGAHSARSTTSRPLDALHGLRLTAPSGRTARYVVHVDDGRATPSVVTVESVDGKDIVCALGETRWRFHREVDGTTLRCGAHRYQAREDGALWWLWCDGHGSALAVRPAVAQRAGGGTGADDANEVRAALPGIVTGMLVTAGQTVEAGTPLLTLEAMKLVHTLVAPRAGIVERVAVAVGDTIQGGALLVALVAADG